MSFLIKIHTILLKVYLLFSQNLKNFSWYTTVILVTWEVEAGGSQLMSILGSLVTCCLKSQTKRNKTKAVDLFHCEASGFNYQITSMEKKKERKGQEKRKE